MSESATQIHVSETEQERPRMLVISVRDKSSREPLARTTVKLTIEGDGTLEASQAVTEQDLATDDRGETLAAWWEYPRYQPRRRLHSVVRAECAMADSEVRISNLDAEGQVRVPQL